MTWWYACWQLCCLLTVVLPVDSCVACWQLCCLLTVMLPVDSCVACWQVYCLLTVMLPVDSYVACWQSCCLLTVMLPVDIPLTHTQSYTHTHAYIPQTHMYIEKHFVFLLTYLLICTVFYGKRSSRQYHYLTSHCIVFSVDGQIYVIFSWLSMEDFNYHRCL